MINTDHYICGKEELSQDYALSGMEPVPYTIIADGCGMAKYSDVGAMVLAHAARNVLGSYSDKVIGDYYLFGKAVINQAEIIANTLGRPKTILDATLGITWIKDNRIYIRFYGDGIVFLIYEDQLRWYKISFDNNMPYYLRYWVDAESQKLYTEQVNEYHVETKLSHEQPYEAYYKFDVPFDMVYDAEKISLIGIASDGLTALFDKNSDAVLELEDVLKEVTALKNRTGRFVVRRMRRMLDNYKKNEIVQGDDISVGVISLE